MTRVIIFAPRRLRDARGWFTESYNQRREREAGIFVEFIQDNESFSVEVGTIRGFHFQVPPSAQSKLVRCVSGRLLDVVVDFRSGSPTFGQHFKVELSLENGRQIFIPHGFAHGFVTLEPNTRIGYKVDAHYDAACDGGFRWDCPELAIDWELAGALPVLSDKDSRLPCLSDVESPFVYDGDPLDPVIIN